ncbi:hypothetical protein [Glycomyces xiaoerkulensis]|uniref:hypothetical protein n=1 Tax=Glycomyces xiaoerkulensis TaxID=2038139 RepID=UPI00130003CF|nr:hypothetical protein [Glycomyces xiaoerkulensis]
MKRILLTLIASIALVGTSTMIAGTAGAAPAVESTTAATQTCTAVAIEHRAVWAEPGTASGTAGAVVAGDSYTAECGLVKGESYFACGSSTDLWAYVNHSGSRWGYVPSTCLSWAS